MTPPRLQDEAADVIIVGGGLAGCAAAAALDNGRRRIVVLESQKGHKPRFSGELLHPTGVAALQELRFLPALQKAGGSEIAGFACHLRNFSQIQAEAILPYHEMHDGNARGFAIDHQELVKTLRSELHQRPGIEFRFGERVNAVLRQGRRVTGVISTGSRWQAPLVLGCDGRHSKLRPLLGIAERAILLSYMAAVRLQAVSLPQPGYGHIFLGAWGPILAYSIGGDSVRVCIDIPPDTDRGMAGIVQRIRRELSCGVAPEFAAAIAASLNDQAVAVAANYWIAAKSYSVPGAALLGDACGCVHPVTASGMTTALQDCQQLGHLLQEIELADHRRVDAALASYQQGRAYRMQARELLADLLYQVFRGPDVPLRVLRQGLFDYWEHAAARGRSLALLAGQDSRKQSLILEYLRVIGRSAHNVLRAPRLEASLGERAQTLLQLGLLSLQKTNQVLGTRRDSHELRFSA